jgi:hypothetical protein
MPRPISKSDIDFGLIRIGADEVWVWIDREAKQLIVGGREFDLSQLTSGQVERLDAMASAVLAMGNANDAVRRDLAVLADELIQQANALKNPPAEPAGPWCAMALRAGQAVAIALAAACGFALVRTRNSRPASAR